MNRINSYDLSRTAFAFALLVSLSLTTPVLLAAQDRAPTSRRTKPTSSTPLPSTSPLSASIDPFAAMETEVRAGKILSQKFHAEADPKTKATAQVALRNQTLLVRLQAKNMPPPSQFGVPRYALWVYVPNYQVKMYIGDLPITLTSNNRGESDSAYRFTALPPGAIYGGLILTAEPVRFTPIVDEALRPVLVALVPEVDPQNVGPALAVYAGPLPSMPMKNSRDGQNVPTPNVSTPETDKKASPKPSRKHEKRSTER